MEISDATHVNVLNPALPAAGSNMQLGGQLISKLKLADEPLSHPHAYVGMVQHKIFRHIIEISDAVPHRRRFIAVSGSMFCELVRG